MILCIIGSMSLLLDTQVAGGNSLIIYESNNCRLEVISGTFYIHLNDSMDVYEGFDFQAGISLDTLDETDLIGISIAILKYLEDGSSIE
jgi:hypothetical protein